MIDSLQTRINFARAWNAMQREVHALAVEKGWWQQERSALELLTLIASEIGEGIEGLRKPGPSDKIPQFSQIEEELADTLIRIMDACEAFSIYLGANVAEVFPEGLDSHDGFALAYASFLENIDLCFLISNKEQNLYAMSMKQLNDIELIGLLITQIGRCIDAIRPGGNYNTTLMTMGLRSLVHHIMAIGQLRGWQIGRALVAKNEYNRTRPVRHGGKLY